MRSTSAAFCGVFCALLVPSEGAGFLPTPTTTLVPKDPQNIFLCPSAYPPPQSEFCINSCANFINYFFTETCTLAPGYVWSGSRDQGDIATTTAITTPSTTTANSTTSATSINSPTPADEARPTPADETRLTPSGGAGSTPSGKAGPVTNTTSPKPKNHGALAGGVVAGIVFVALLAGAFFFWRRRRQHAASTRDFDSLEKSIVSSPVYPAPITPYNVPSPPPQLYQGPAITPVESHHLMGGYSELSQQHRGGGVVPAVVAAKYAAGNQREVDEDGVSLRSPSPVQDGSRIQEARDSVPRLPIYNRGSEIADRGPAL